MTDGQTTGEEAKQIVKELMDGDRCETAASPLAVIGERGDDYVRQKVEAAVRQATDGLTHHYNKRLQWLALMTWTIAGWAAPLTYGLLYWVYAGTLPNIGMGAAMALMIGCTLAGGMFGWWAGK